MKIVGVSRHDRKIQAVWFVNQSSHGLYCSSFLVTNPHLRRIISGWFNTTARAMQTFTSKATGNT